MSGVSEGWGRDWQEGSVVGWLISARISYLKA